MAVWMLEVIRMDGPQVPLRILEQIPMPTEIATEDYAKEVLQEKCLGPSYRIVGGPYLRPEGVRLLDETGTERFCYTVVDLHRDGGTISPRKA